MKKLMALCLAVLMVLSMCSFTVMAEETAEAVLFEDISNGQIPEFITSDLAIPAGATVTSTNPVVISETGKVTRPLFEDEVVTLTVNGTAFNVIVKAIKTITTEALTFESEETGSSLVGTTGWSASLGANADSSVKGAIDVATSSDGNNYAAVGIATEYTSATYTFQNFSEVSGAKYVGLQFDVSHMTGKGCYNYDFYVNHSLAARVINLNQHNGGGLYSWDLNLDSPWHGSTRSPKATSPIGDNNFITVKVVIDVTTKKVSFNAGGIDLATYDVASDIDFSSITSLSFRPRGREVTSNGAFSEKAYVDNIIAYVETDGSNVLDIASPQAKLEYFTKYLEEDHITNGRTTDMLAGNLNFTAPELGEHGTITWETDTNIITEDGIVVGRKLKEEVSTTITGTLTVNGLTTTRTHSVLISPITTCDTSEFVDFDTVGKASDFSKHTSVVEDGSNKYAAIDLVSGKGSCVTYSFGTVPSTAKYIILEFKLKTSNHSDEGASNITNFGLMLNGTTAQTSAEVAEFINWSNDIKVQNTFGTSSINQWHGSSAPSKSYITNTDDFARFKIEVDTESATASLYLNEKKINSTPVATRFNNFANINSASWYVEDRNSGATVYVDDLFLYTIDTEDVAISKNSDAKKVEIFKNLVEESDITGKGVSVGIDENLELNVGYKNNNLEACGVSIDWKSSDPSVITDAGVVTPVNSLIPKNVTMTATITAGQVVETIPFHLQVAQAGTTNISRIDFENKAGTDGYVVDENPAHATVLHKNAPAGSSTLAADSGASGGGFADRMLISADVKYSHDKEAVSNNGGVQVNGIQGADSCFIVFNFKSNQIGFGTTRSVANEAGTALRSNDIDTLWYPMPEFLQDKEGEWINVVFDFNIMSQTYEVYADGILVTPHPLVRRNAYKTDTGSSTVRGISTVSSAAGDVWLDNVTLRKFSDANVAEVNAALNAAVVLYASDVVHPALTNRTLVDKTISKSWIKNNSDFYKDETDIHNNPARYTLQTDGPSITYKINGEPVTAIDVDAPKTVEFTITATSADSTVTESKTFTKKLAPASIRGLGLNGRNAFNGLWLEGITGDEKVIVAHYFDDKFVSAKIIEIADNASYEASTGLLMNMSTKHPYLNPDVDQIKLFVVKADGITPLAYANAELHD